MAEPGPLTSIDWGGIIAVLAALGTVIATLWKWGQGQIAIQRLMFEAQITALKADATMRLEELRDLVTRVRGLEADRVADLKTATKQMAEMTLKSFEEAAQNRAVLRDIARILNARPCIAQGCEEGKVPEPSSDKTYYQRSRERHEKLDALEPHKEKP